MNSLISKKKVGILTLPLRGNYGGVLQAFALQTFLKQNGFEAYLVDRRWDIRNNKTLSYYIQKFVFHYVIRKKVMDFCDEWIVPKTAKIDSQAQMKAINKANFDAFIVGSDQVWRLEHIGGVKDNFFLDFVESPKVKKIAYAASFGKDSVDGSPERLKKVSLLMQKFNAISVREKSGVSICSDVFDVKAEHVIDPVLLLNYEDFLPIIEMKHSKKLNQKLITYVLDDSEENKALIKSASLELGLEIESINYKKDPALLLKNKAFDFYNYIYPSVSNWIRGFRDADFIITDSFHGTVFSILFKKQFIVIGNEKRGLARFNSILGKLGLTHRLLTDSNKFNKSMLFDKIDYESVFDLLEIERKKSKSFLLDALN